MRNVGLNEAQAGIKISGRIINNLRYAGNTTLKAETKELEMEQQTGSKLGKEYIKAVYCYPVYLTSMQSTS